MPDPNHTHGVVRPRTAVLTRGFDPTLSVGSARPAVFRSSTYVFPSPEEAEHAFAITTGKIQMEDGGRADLIYSRFSHPNAEILEDQIVPLDAVRCVAQNQVAIAVLAGDFERRLVVARPAPTGELLVLEHLAGIERGDVAALRRGGQVVHTPQRRAPIQMPQRPIRANSHGVRTLARGQQPDLAGFRILNRLGRESSGCQQGNTEESEWASHDRPPV